MLVQPVTISAANLDEAWTETRLAEQPADGPHHIQLAGAIQIIQELQYAPEEHPRLEESPRVSQLVPRFQVSAGLHQMM